MKSRIQWIDIARGIAILAVIVGHTLGPYTGGFLGSLIFAFHMPIFFILSGYLYHQRPLQRELKNGSLNLLVPYAITSILVLLISIVALQLPANPLIMGYFTSTKAGVVSILYGAGSAVFAPWQLTVQPLGALWFLLSMFVAMQLFNGGMSLAQRTHYPVAVRLSWVVGLTVLGGRLGQVIYLPWALNAALFAQSFLYAGFLIKQYHILDWLKSWHYIGFILLWVLSARSGYFNLNVPSSPNLLLSFGGGIAGSLCIFRVSTWLARFDGRPGLKLLEQYGRLSLIILCFHLIDLNVIGIEGHLYHRVDLLMGAGGATVVTILYRIGFVTVAMFLVPKVPVIRSCYLMRQYPFTINLRRKMVKD
ncbi:acetyltransferase [Lactobacillus sp. CBA3605]|uniref:acyltransferase family protein n=1 Tax=Lactobacillus sp. CBA3605 TaxID=2099788 RepID=UPI000CFDBD8C|nr:acyltransferase family protein [Lactobacillus sp. CBA3605]AVK62251.1 acetyltransferase [Lactobacillus sp. CBA3605]